MRPSQAARLAKPVPDAFVSQVPAGGNRKADYVSHAVITEILLAVVGPFDWSVQPVRAADGAIVGALGTLSCEVDGRRVTVTEVGDTTGQESDEGGALKNASSDALKRAAMRLGLGLSLWSGAGSYFLHRQLTADAKRGVEGGAQPATEPSTPGSPCEVCGADLDAGEPHSSDCEAREL